MKKLFTLLTLMIVAITTSWGVKPTITGLTASNVPDAPTTALNLATQTDFEADKNGWIVFYTKGVVDSKAWWGKTQTNGGSTTWTVPSGATAPFKGASSSTNRFTMNTTRVHAISFTGAEKASFLGKASSSSGTYRNFLVNLYSFDGTTLSLVESKTTGDQTAVTELLFEDLTKSTVYVAYAYGDQTSNSDFYEVALFASTATKHKVEYDLGDATGGTAPTQADVAEGAKFTVANAPGDLVAPTGKEFKCWNDGTNNYNEGAEYTMGTSDVTLTAVYQNETVKYAVSYAAGEGTGSMDGTEKAEGAVFYLPASTFTVPEGKVFANWLCSVDGETYAAGDPYTMTAEATTFTAQYASVAPKIIYSLVDGIGSAAVTADQATVTDGTSLVLTNSAGRITITAVTGDTFKNGDAIAFSGTIGNTARDYGIKYGASEANTNLYVAAGQPCSVSGTLTLSANSSTLVMGRYAASTTTMTDFVVSRTVGVSSESIANIYINGVSATEGTDYTVSGNTITLSKTYFVCPTVRIVGNATFADASTGKTNHPVTLAFDEDVYTGTTSIAGTSYTVNVPYKGGESIDLSNTAGYNYGFGGYCAPENFTLTGGTAYAAKIVNDKIVLTSYDTEYIPKNTDVIIAGDKGASVTITYTSTTTPNLVFPDNDLKGTNERTLTSTLKGTASKFLTLQKSTSKFIQYTGEYFPANRAYMLIAATNSGDSFEMVFADEATAIKEVNAGENANSVAPVKVIKNGNLFIGNYNIAGQQVK